MGLFGFVGRRLTSYSQASNTMWLICRAARPRTARWSMRYCLMLCEVTSLVPPPPSPRMPFLRWLRLVAWFVAALVVTFGNQYKLLAGARAFMEGFSTISQVSFLASTLMTAVQPLVVLANNLLHLRAIAPPVSGLLMPPLRGHASFVVSAAVTFGLLLGKHGLYFESHRKPVLNNVLECSASLISLTFDTLVMFLCMCAKDKLQDINARLSAVGRVRPELRALVLETAARQYELTADQISLLGSFSTMGLPLACNSIRHRVKLVTDSFLVYRAVEKASSVHPRTLAALILQLSSGIGRIVVSATAGEALFGESKRTMSVLGAVNTAGWPERERLLVVRLIRNSRRGVRWSMGGLAYLDHSFMLSVIGSTATYLVVLMQYKDPAVDNVLNSVNGTSTNITLPS